MSATSSKTLLTEGPIWKRMTAFAIPIFLGNLFQQLYNTADSLIVGNFLGSNALAAVSSSGSLIFLLVGFFNGIAIGAGVVIARYFGARQTKDLQKAIHTTIGFGLISGVLLTILGILLAPKNPGSDEDSHRRTPQFHPVFPYLFPGFCGFCPL